MNKNYISNILSICTLIALAGVILFFFAKDIAVYVYGIGAIGLAMCRYLNPLSDGTPRLKRLYVQQCISTVLYLSAIYFMATGRGYWIYCVMVATVIDIIIMFRLPKEKEN